jgi:hypothetical protein
MMMQKKKKKPGPKPFSQYTIEIDAHKLKYRQTCAAH